MDAAQQLKLRERQRFFEEVFQHDVDVYLSSAHLSIRDYKRREFAPIGSISSMEVNVDLLDQMELIDISDQDTLDVFFSSGEETVLTAPITGMKRLNAHIIQVCPVQPPSSSTSRMETTTCRSSPGKR
uniref:Uncharacterized protein n=1 Tax=Periophthalmus magnuspinnatus TaxID=409849 RepID=A0A3B4AW09_9GOBI